MGALAEQILEEVLKLPSDEQVDLFERLGARLERDHGELLSDAWREEIMRRIALHDAGEVEAIPVEDVERELWAEQLADERASASR